MIWPKSTPLGFYNDFVRSAARTIFFNLLVAASAQQPINLGWDFLSRGLGSSDEKTQLIAIAAAGTVGPVGPVINELKRLAADKKPEIRFAALRTLAVMKERSAEPLFRGGLKDGDPAIRFVSARALYEFGDKSGRDVLLQALAGNLRGEKSGAMQGLAKQLKGMPGEFWQMVRNPAKSQGIGGSVLNSFAGPVLGPVKLVQDAAKPEDEPAPGRIIAAYLLADDVAEQTTAQLLKASLDDNVNVQMAAVRALGQRPRTPEVQQRLETVLDEDSSTATKYAAAASLVRLQYLHEIQPAAAHQLQEDMNCQGRPPK